MRSHREDTPPEITEQTGWWTIPQAGERVTVHHTDGNKLTGKVVEVSRGQLVMEALGRTYRPRWTTTVRIVLIDRR